MCSNRLELRSLVHVVALSDIWGLMCFEFYVSSSYLTSKELGVPINDRYVKIIIKFQCKNKIYIRVKHNWWVKYIGPNVGPVLLYRLPYTWATSAENKPITFVGSAFSMYPKALSTVKNWNRNRVNIVIVFFFEDLVFNFSVLQPHTTASTPDLSGSKCETHSLQLFFSQREQYVVNSQHNVFECSPIPSYITPNISNAERGRFNVCQKTLLQQHW